MKIIVKDKNSNIICESKEVGFISIDLEDGEIARYERRGKMGGMLINDISSAYFYDFRDNN